MSEPCLIRRSPSFLRACVKFQVHVQCVSFSCMTLKRRRTSPAFSQSGCHLVTSTAAPAQRQEAVKGVSVIRADLTCLLIPTNPPSSRLCYTCSHVSTLMHLQLHKYTDAFDQTVGVNILGNLLRVGRCAAGMRSHSPVLVVDLAFGGGAEVVLEHAQPAMFLPTNDSATSCNKMCNSNNVYTSINAGWVWQRSAKVHQWP